MEGGVCMWRYDQKVKYLNNLVDSLFRILNALFMTFSSDVCDAHILTFICDFCAIQ